MKSKWIVFFIASILSLLAYEQGKGQSGIIICSSSKNDVVTLLKANAVPCQLYTDPAEAVHAAAKGGGIMFLADDYPSQKVRLPDSIFLLARQKQLRIYIEYPASLPRRNIPDTVITERLDRAVVTSDIFTSRLMPMSILGINDCHVVPVKAINPFIVLGKVAGFDKAVYGIEDVKTYPLLFQKNNLLIAATRLSSFATGRYEPEASWKIVWQYILSWVSGDPHLSLDHWVSYVSPMYGKDDPLPRNAKEISIQKGVSWFYKAHLLIDSSWKNIWLKYQGDGSRPFGPPVNPSLPNGDGSLGILEGHASNIYYNGTQQYRYWVRADVQGESAYAFAAAGNFLNKKDYYSVATHLGDFIFHHSNLRSGNKNDKNSPVYGLIGWAVTHPRVFYGDDNARCILGLIGAEAWMNTSRWDKEIAEAILANFRTTGKEGFRGNRLLEGEIMKKGWEYYWNRDLISPHPHYESWLWACYLWFYDKTGYKPLLEKAKNAIRITMQDYPEKWLWTNGIQQERARMVLPLAWLVRIEDTPEHRKWLDRVVSDLLKNQVASGAIREELGAAEKSGIGFMTSNQKYGSGEASLIFKNGDPVADMLYTCNFAFFSLNEAAHATGNKRYYEAVNKLSDFLTRIQVNSSKFRDLDGAWFRAFDYKSWDYWASNADAGWGAWCTLSGWIQSWIITTQILVEEKQSYWELTKNSSIAKYMDSTIMLMFNNDMRKKK